MVQTPELYWQGRELCLWSATFRKGFHPFLNAAVLCIKIEGSKWLFKVYIQGNHTCQQSSAIARNSSPESCAKLLNLTSGGICYMQLCWCVWLPWITLWTDLEPSILMHRTAAKNGIPSEMLLTINRVLFLANIALESVPCTINFRLHTTNSS